MLWCREDILKYVDAHEHLKRIFNEWRPEEQKEFLNICTGVRGVKMLYDGFFKEIMNPEYAPQRLDDFLTQVLGRKTRVTKVLPNDSTRLTDESSLLVMDIVVEFEDGAIGNIEVQKMGYLFPGERSACYSADLLLRQYKRLRDEKKREFSYRDIRTVYTIVLFEHNAQKLFKPVREHIIIFWSIKRELKLSWRCLRNLSTYHLTSLEKNSKMKMEVYIINWRHG